MPLLKKENRTSQSFREGRKNFMSYSKLKIWLMAIRPKTLSASIAPVVIGTGMAYGDGICHFPTAAVCLITAIFIQVGTNLANDYFDFKKGADTQERIGPTRVTQAGLISQQAIKASIFLTFTLAALSSLYLINRGGWPLAIIAGLAILSGLLYTAGPCPLGYIGLGDLFVFIFFGIVAVAGTYYVQSFELNMAVVLAGIAPGLISMAILTVNNLRDIDTDRQHGKKTLAVRFGRSFAQTEYLLAVISAGLTPLLIYLFIKDHPNILLCPLVLLGAIPGIKTVLTKTDGPSLNAALAFSGQMLLVYSVLFAIGWIL